MEYVKMIKKLMMIAVLVLSALGFNAALAHGDDRPMHGGTMQSAGGLSFELVARDGGAVLYIVDHGEPVPTQGLSGKLTVLNGAEKSEAEFTVVGNTLVAKAIKLPSGAKAVATLTNAEKQTITVRFSVH
jgi:hypothetical protein